MTASLPTPRPGILSIAPYIPGKTSRAGGAPLKLSSNENPYGASPAARAAYLSAAGALHRYPDGSATALREAIAEVHGLDPARIICGAGSDELIGLLVHAYAGAGDEVLYSAHGFLMYGIYAKGCGATPVTAPERNLTADVDALLAAVTQRTNILFLANPNNPTGSYLPAAELRRLRDALPSHVILAVDAAYAEYPDSADYDDGRDLAQRTENTVMFRTFSKIYGLPALRLGWMYGAPAIVDVLNRLRSPFNVSAPAQAAGVAAVRDTGWIAEQKRLNAEGRALMRRELEARGYHVYPGAANFLLIGCGAAERAAELVSSLAAQEIYVRDVVAYGLPECVRITVGTEEENARLLAAIPRCG
jgi:histidinol-phosphate aminotransferase